MDSKEATQSGEPASLNPLDTGELTFRCNAVLELSAIPLPVCSGIVRFSPGAMMAQCDTGGHWRLVGDQTMDLIENSTGATRGIAHKVRIRASQYSKLELRCGDPYCHFTVTLHGYEQELGALITVANEHPCPQPPGEKVAHAIKAAEVANG